MKVFLFAAHGSRREESNREVENFFKNLFNFIKADFDTGECCFLQFGSPLFEDLLEEVIEKGAKEVFIFPYFLFNGAHVTVDIPEITKNISLKYPDCSVKILKALGDIEGFDSFLSESLIREIKNV